MAQSFRALGQALGMIGTILALSACGNTPHFSRWTSDPRATPTPATGGLSGIAVETNPGRPAPQSRFFLTDPGDAELAAFTAASELRGTAADNAVRYYSRDLGNGARISYVVAELRTGVIFRVITADGATLTSDERGDTMWADGQAHLATIHEMANAAYSRVNDTPPIAAMAFGFHGNRTSDEGTVVIDGQLQHINPWRSAICLGFDGLLTIGIYDRRGLGECAQAAGAGPVLLWGGKIATPDVSTPTDEFLPYNPLGEDFQQIDYRIENYRNGRPKTALCVGNLSDRTFYIVLANATGATGDQVARALRDLGCTDGIGGDDGLSTQMVWQGAAVDGVIGREVPTGIGIYVTP